MSVDGSPGVLIVDDQADLRALLQTILRHYGFRTYLAAQATDALAFLRTDRDQVNLMLLDAAMPDCDPVHTLRELQKIRPHLAVCFLTGDSHRSDGKELIAEGAARVIHKPFAPSELAQSLWELVPAHDRRTEARRERHWTHVKVGAGLEPKHVVESWIGDQTRDGLRLRLPEKLADVGALLSIRLADLPDDTPWIPVQIRHMRPEAGMWTAGCRFLHPAARQLA